MPFQNEIIGTNGVLIRNWLQSANYVAGVSGWQITKAGNAEFNNGTFRGSIAVGTSPGQRFIVNNPATGDVIDIYDSSNRLVFFLSALGAEEFISYPSGAKAIYEGNGVFLTNAITPLAGDSGVSSIIGTGSQLVVNSGQVSGAAHGSSFTLNDSNASGSGEAWIGVTQRNISGTVVQTDSLGTDNVLHMFHGVSTSQVVSGFPICFFNHGASFLPAGAVIVPYDGPSVSHGYTFNVENINSTQVEVSLSHTDGTAVAAGEGVECYAIVFA